MKSSFFRITRYAFVLALSAGCSCDDTSPDGTGGGTSEGGGTTGVTSTGGSADGGSAQGGAENGGGGATNASTTDATTVSTGGADYGPCFGAVEDFQNFDPDSTQDLWEPNGGIALSDGADRALLATPDEFHYAGIYTTDAASMQSCYFTIAVEGDQQPGSYILELLEINDTGRKILLEVQPGTFAVADVYTPSGDANDLGSGTVNGNLRGMRIQLLPDGSMQIEIKDDTGWEPPVIVKTPPTWTTAPMFLSLGYRGDSPETAIFDDVGVEAP